MQFQSTVRVLGMKGSKGTMDNGQAFDSTKAYIEMGLDSSKGTMKGVCTTEYAFGTFENWERFKNLDFPFHAEATFENVSNGRNMKTILVDLKPARASQAAAPAAPKA